MEDKREIIQRIRRRYNQDVQHTDPDAAEAAAANMQTIAGAAKLLSHELYTKPTHFVFELVQNADDCSYHDDAPPSLLLILFDDALLTCSNEAGFSAADIRAICDISKSTKSRRVGAFTGEKGIGFKATAVVSEVTYIDSNGYQFAFDMRAGAYDVPHLGLVCPRWEDDLTSRMQAWVAEKLQQLQGCDGGCTLAGDVLQMVQTSTTRIFMCLKPDCDRQLLAAQMADLSPFMLLNLRKLRNMNVLIAAAGQGCHTRSFACSGDDGGGRLSITVCEGPWGGSLRRVVHNLICLRRTIQVPAALADQEEKRQGVEEVELVFGLPMADDGSSALPDIRAQLFAFLPVRPYGLRFHVQADFILPSSREGILERSAWNVWLRDELAPVFVGEALQALSMGTISCNALLQFLPLPGDVQEPFLREASNRMLELLQQEACVLTASGQLVQPAAALMPEPLLTLADGEPLVSNDWLQAGLPGTEYVSADLLTGDDGDRDSGSGSNCSTQRTAAVLRQLGCGSFSAVLLLRWLKAAGTRQLLQGLPAPQRGAWLQGLYRVLQQMTLQPSGSCLCMAKANQWSSSLGAAPILQVHGEQQLSTVNKARGRGRLFLWNPELGDETELALFSGDTHRLLFVERAAQSAAWEGLLQHFWGIRRVDIATLVEELLQQQAALALTHVQQEQLLQFLLRNKDRLGAQEWQQLQSRLQLRSAGDSYSLASLLHLPLAVSSQQVPAELQDDLVQAGLAFLHARTERCLAGGGAAGGKASGAAWDFLRQLGVQQLSRRAAAEALLRLYASEESWGSIREEAHLRHISFLAASSDVQHDLQPSIRSTLWLYTAAQSLASEAPDSLAARLFWSGAEEAISCQLREAGWDFLHPCYRAATDAERIQHFLLKVAGVSDGPDQVIAALLELHATPADLQSAADSLQLQLAELLLQQLGYLARVRPHLSSDVAVRCASELPLLSSRGELLLGRQLHLPPEDHDAAQIMLDLAQSAADLHMLADSFQPLAADDESRLVLTKLLGVQQADTAAVIRCIAGLHASSSCSVLEDSRHTQLAFLAKHIPVLEQNPQLLQQVQQSVLLQDAAGNHATAAELHLPLARQFAELQADMLASGMRFLHANYLAGARASTTAARRKQKQLQELLVLLGVQVPDTAAVVQHILQLYQLPSGGTLPDFPRHRLHLQFLRDHWSVLDAALKRQVKEQLQLCLHPGGTVSFKPGSPGLVYELPRAESWEAEMLATLQLGGASFLSPEYSSSNSSSAAEGQPEEDAAPLQHWLRELGVKRLMPAAAAGFLLAAHSNSKALTATHSTHQIVRHGLFFAAHAPELDRATLLAAKQQLLLALQPASPGAAAAYSSANQQPIYYPAAGGGWQLQHVLLASEVAYIHPAYARGARSLQQESQGIHQFAGLQSFFITHMDLHMRPVAGSAKLDAAVAAGNRWRPLLLLLADNWPYYSPRDQQALLQQLRHMQVMTSGGQRQLQDCFLPSPDCSSQLLAMLRDLGLPFLELPRPVSGSSWAFLRHFGVSTGLDQASLLKILRQLSSSNAAPESRIMQSLYEQLHARAMISAQGLPELRQAFQQEALVFAPAARAPVAAGSAPAGRWLSLRDPGLLWAGNRKIFPRKTFLRPHYKDLEAFFCDMLGVRSTRLDDLQDALLELSDQPVTGDTAALVLEIYKELAGSASSLAWLPQLLQRRVLLVESPGSEPPEFASAASAAPYLPDDTRLVQLFRDGVALLAVPTDELPGLKPLLALVRPRLRSLSRSVRRRYSDNQVSSAGAMRPDARLTQLLRQLLRLAARYLYHLAPQAYTQLLSSGQLEQLAQMSACLAPGLVEVLSLGGVAKEESAGAAVVRGSVLVNSALGTRAQLRHISSEVAALLCKASSDPALLGKIGGKIEGLARDLAEGNSEEVDEQLGFDNIGEIPPDKLPSSWQAGPALQQSKQVWEADEDDDDGEAAAAAADTTSSTADQAAQLASALGRVQLSPPPVATPEPVAPATAVAAVQQEALPACASGAGPAESSPSPSMEAGTGGSARQRKHLRVKRFSAGSSPQQYPSSQQCAATGAEAGSLQQPDASSEGPAAHSTAQFSELAVEFRGSSSAGQFGISAAATAGAAATDAAADAPSVEQQMQQVLAAADAADSSALQQLLRAASPASSSLLAAGDFAGWVQAPAAATPAAAGGSSTAGTLPSAVFGFERFERSVRVCQEVTFSEAITRQAAPPAYTESTPAAAAPAAPSAATTAGSAAAPGPAASAWPGDEHQLTGVLGELYAYRWLSRQLPDFTADNFHSGARQHLGLPAPSLEPSYDFLYDDAAGLLSGVPGTRCFIEVKSTAADLTSYGNGSPKPIQVSAREWELAQQAHRLQLQAAVAAAGAGDDSGSKQQFIIVRVDRVGCPGGPRVVSLLRDPVRLLAEGRIGITGQQLLLHSYPVVNLD